MKSAITMTVVAGLMIFGVASAAQAQNQFFLWQDVHINPGKAAEFEQVRAGRNTGMAAANVRFGRTVYSDDRGTFRLTIPLANMADLDRMRTQESAMTGGNPTLAREVIHHIETSIQQLRSELSYQPITPRVPADEVGFYRGFHWYLKFGTVNEAADIVRQIRALYEENNLQVGYTFFTKVTGSGPDFSAFLPARDAADFYSNYFAALGGAPVGALVAQLNELSYRTDNLNSTRRQDLDYQPPN